jgi:DNA-binding winged helix-turn-helix (wHTH) protein/Flp pilus assembly protein TadD
MEKLAFGPFRLDAEECRLLRDGVEIELRPQAFNALKVLIRHSGRYVEYDQMIREAWIGTMVTKHTVAVTVGEVKKALQEYGSWISYRPGHGYRLEVPKSQDLIRMAEHLWLRQTREGLEKALGCFERAAQEDSGDFRAFQGISICYLSLGTYGMRPSPEMHRGFLEAHERAVALAGLTPDLRGDRAHGLHVFERRIAEAEAELLTALREEPQSSILSLRLTMLYATSRRLNEAIETLERAKVVHPLWPMLPPAEIFLRLCRGEIERAIACGQEAIDLHPYLPLCRSLYAQALQTAGQWDEALRQYRISCVMCPDLPWLRAVEGACLAASGRAEEACAVLAELQELRQTEYVDAYFMVLLLEALGRRNDAITELERARHENSATLFLLDVDPRMDPLRSDPRFSRIRNGLFAAVYEPQASVATG